MGWKQSELLNFRSLLRGCLLSHQDVAMALKPRHLRGGVRRWGSFITQSAILSYSPLEMSEEKNDNQGDRGRRKA